MYSFSKHRKGSEIKTIQKFKLTLLFIFFICTGCDRVISPVAMLSISSDGNYIISTHYGHVLILWDVRNKIKKILSFKANIFSPYFIPNSDHFMWQNIKTKEVYIQSVSGKIIKKFKINFLVFGHVADEHHYVASDAKWNLYFMKNNQLERFQKDYGGYRAHGKLLNLSLHKQYLLTSGDADFEYEDVPFVVGRGAKDINHEHPERLNYSLQQGVVLWDAQTGKPIRKLLGNVFKTAATLSPDEQYTVSGDENVFSFIWENKTGKRRFLSNPKNMDPDDLLPKKKQNNRMTPKDFYQNSPSHSLRTVAVRFIDEHGNYIRFIYKVSYGILYNVKSSKTQAYIPLGTEPKPYVYSSSSSANIIDTAPKANILVMAQTPTKRGNTGIIVYHYDDKTKTLERIWAPEGPPPHHRVMNKENPWEG